MKSYFLFSVFCLCFSVFLNAQRTKWIDDIVPDSAIDDANFKICNAENQVIQYFNSGKSIQYEGEKPAIEQLFYSNYQAIDSSQSGLIRIRFVVNCSGETGRFRLLTSDLNYQPFQFNTAITNQLLQITKSMKGWQPLTWKGLKVDYYQYLIFKIEKGNLTHILP